MYCKQEILSQIELFDEKQAKKLQLSSIIRAIDKLEEKEIHDSGLEEKFQNLKDLLGKIKDDYKGNKSAFSKAFNEITEYIRKEHNLVAKGYFSTTYMSLGIAIGIAMGAVFMTTLGIAYIGVGLPIGIAVGIALGGAKDKKAAESGLQY